MAPVRPTEAAKMSFGSAEQTAYRAHLLRSKLPSLSAKADNSNSPTWPWRSPRSKSQGASGT
jgi:hypothetical protein